MSSSQSGLVIYLSFLLATLHHTYKESMGIKYIYKETLKYNIDMYIAIYEYMKDNLNIRREDDN